MAKSRPKPEERNLAPEQFADLNRQFYGARLQPHDYLMHRYRGVFLASQSPEDLSCGFDNKLSIGDMQASWTADEWDALEARDYVSTESTVLLHHSCEALFRLYFAHADSPECPWLAVARLRLPVEFKGRLARFMEESQTEAVAQSVMNVFVGHPTSSEANQERWDTIKDGLVLLLQHLGRRLQDETPLYNSAKHGLSLVPGAAAMSFGDPEGPVAIRADGPSITYLTVKTGQRGKRWAQETVWLDSALNLALTVLAIHQLGNLWHVARHRYTGEAWDASTMRYLTADLVNSVLRPRKSPDVQFIVPSMSMELLYYVDEDEESSDLSMAPDADR